jgi:hypothetical protein
VVDHREEWGNVVSRKHGNVKMQGFFNYKTKSGKGQCQKCALVCILILMSR